MIKENNYGNITPACKNYRDLSLPEAFNFKAGINYLPKNGLYFVSFFSEGNPNASAEVIKEVLALDEQAAAEASGEPDFHYYYPDIRFEGKALSYCIWGSVEAARQATAQPHHRAAVEFIERERPYLKYIISGYLGRKIDDQIIFDQLFSHTFPVESLA